MVEFRFITNDLNSTTYDGPSGFRYIIYLNKPFTVKTDQDVAFFRNNHRFEEVDVVKEIISPPEPKKDIDELFKEELDKSNINDKTKEIITKAYLSQKDFVEDLEEGFKLDPTISKTEINKLKFYFLKPKKINKPKKKTKRKVV